MSMLLMNGVIVVSFLTMWLVIAQFTIARP